MFDMALLDNAIDVLAKVFVYGSNQGDIITFLDVHDISLPCTCKNGKVAADVVDTELIEYIKGYLKDYFTEPRDAYSYDDISIVNRVVGDEGLSKEDLHVDVAEDGYVTCFSLENENLRGRTVTEVKIGSYVKRVNGWRKAEEFIVDTLIKIMGIEKVVELIKSHSKSGKSFVKMSGKEFSDKALFSKTEKGAYLRFENPKTILSHIILMSNIIDTCIYLKLEDR